MSHPEYRDNTKNVFFFNVILGILFLTAAVFLVLVFRPYVYSALLAFVLFTGTRKYYLKLKDKLSPRYENALPWAMTLGVCIVVFLPTYFLIRTLIQESLSILFKIRIALSEDKIVDTITSLEIVTDFFTDTEFFWVRIPEIYAEFAQDYIDLLNLDSLYGILSNASSFILGSIELPAGILMNLFFSVLVLFFLYKDGNKIERFFLANLPFSDELETRVARRIRSAIETVIQGNLIISLLQGFMVYLFLLLVGMSSPFLYASIAAFFSLIPIIGTAVIWLPVGLYLLLIENNLAASLTFMIASFSAYLILENLVKPKILDKKLNTHPLLIFFSLLGGLKQFGIMGVIIGPVTVTAVVILWDFWKIYRSNLFSRSGGQ